MTRLFRSACLASLLASLLATAAPAADTTVAVAANFTAAAQEIGAAFTAATGDTVTFSFAATGQLYTQISQGAPFDVFLSADQKTPAKAEDAGLAVADSRFTYAIGRLVLYSADPALAQDATALTDPEVAAKVNHVAIANPATAPYGAAAVEAMTGLGVIDAVTPKLVQGTSISQTHQFISTGNAQLGFVALSQVIDDTAGSHWLVPAALYTPIRQDAVVLTRGSDNPAATAFVAFLRSDTARAIIARYGYDTDD